MTLHLSHRDLKLGYFEYIQPRVKALTSGDKLIPTEEGCKNERGEWVLKFSRKFGERMAAMKEKGFRLKEAKVNFVVFWWDEEKKFEVRVVLPEVGFERDVS